jgi:hypothetical protein
MSKLSSGVSLHDTCTLACSRISTDTTQSAADVIFNDFNNNQIDIDKKVRISYNGDVGHGIKEDLL